MRFRLVDHIIEQSAERIVIEKHVTLAEEYLADHFPAFPVLPGVMMVEAMVQAARQMLADRGDERLVLGEVRAMRFSNMVRPGEVLEVEVTLAKCLDDASYLCKGHGRVRRSAAAATGEVSNPESTVSGRFTMRPIQHA